MADRSQSRAPHERARLSGGEYQEVAHALKEPAARSLEYWARTRPNEPALFSEDGVLSYFDWNDYADLLADAMAQRGLGPGDVIAMLCRNRMEWAVVALAAAKLDAHLLSLPADLSGDALRQRLIGGRVSAVIIGDGEPAAVSKALVGVPLLLRATMDDAHPGFFSFWDLFGPAAPPRFGHAQPSVIAWTDGKRGPAKGVAIPRRRAAPASVSRPPLPEHGCSLITVPLHRTWGGVQFWEALAAGRTIALMRRFDAIKAVELLTGGGITHWYGLPESFQKLSTLPAALFDKASMRSLKEVVVGGAAVSGHLKAWIMSTFGEVVSEAYGSTEAGLIAFMPASRVSERPSSCGRASRGVMIEIRDANGAVLPSNTTGEIWARTPRTLSADFIGYPSTRSRRDEQGFVATGDLGWLDESGYLYISSAPLSSELSAPGIRLAG